MNIDELDRLLQQSLADLQLSGMERRYFQDWVNKHVTTDIDLAEARGLAFAIAQKHLGEASAPVLTWLAGVLTILQPPSQVSGEAFFSPGTTCVERLVREFNAAKETCDVCVFTITDNRITESIEAAHRRGVAVRVVTDDDKAHDTGSDIRRLTDNGIPCKTDRSPAHMHHKFAIFDRKRLVTGSFNWTRSASEQNDENLIVTPDPVLVTSFLARFEKLWARFKFFGEG
jgi:cardiolipin hydrolase